MKRDSINPLLAREAKAVVALAFRNGPIEDIHAGKRCPTCEGSTEYSRITDYEMKIIMKSAVDHVYKLLWLRDNDPAKYAEQMRYGESFTISWDDPE